MNKKEIHSATVPDCPIRNVISHITDKWSLLVLYTLEQKEVLRFKDLWREIPDISQKMLTSRCENLKMTVLSAERCSRKYRQEWNIASANADKASCPTWTR